jgi:VIT1/CCC1 family predicted Fe2+/Mn2+ transporter
MKKLNTTSMGIGWLIGVFLYHTINYFFTRNFNLTEIVVLVVIGLALFGYGVFTTSTTTGNNKEELK